MSVDSARRLLDDFQLANGSSNIRSTFAGRLHGLEVGVHHIQQRMIVDFSDCFIITVNAFEYVIFENAILLAVGDLIEQNIVHGGSYLVVSDLVSAGALSDALKGRFGSECTFIARDSKRFFFDIARVPNSFDEILLDRAGTDFRIGPFKDAFQPRRATLLADDADREVDLDASLERWARADQANRPVFLLGDRGAGKTWTALHFCLDQLERFRNNPWSAGLPFYLSLHELRAYFGKDPAPFSGLSQACLERYPEVSLFLDGAMFDALLRKGHIIVWLDGFDELVVQPTDELVEQNLRQLIGSVVNSGKVVVTSRPGHFRSMQALMETQVAGAFSVKELFSVLLMSAFSIANRDNYVAIRSHETLESLMGKYFFPLLSRSSLSERHLQEVVAIISCHPAALEAIISLATRPESQKIATIPELLEQIFLELVSGVSAHETDGCVFVRESFGSS